ncbi:TolC family protein [Mucilaginibacter sp.]|uniref:TolC family protein n=1 Tax=Mucilaginibacter sp. TaxID=1882438 RepID=UPI00285060CE|nr:TolC family protein [Mucilaginibacter sp.]MDR3694978.1 TolC family protein [Mucilaginibacter sp.]
MKHIVLIVSLICAVALNGFAQQAPPDSQKYNFTVADCVNYAYEHQDSVINADLDIKSADYKVKETIGSGLPQISGSASFQDYLKTPIVIFGTNKFSIYQKFSESNSISLSQLLFDGSYLVGLKAAKTYKELSQRNYTRSRIETNVNVTKAYYQVLVSNEQVKLLDANIKQLKQQLNETIQQNKQGFVEKIDVDRLTVQYNTLVNNKENVLRLLALNYQVLKFQMGMPIEKELVLKDKLEDVQLGDDLSDLSNDTTFYKNRIEYGLTETNLKLNQLDLKREKSLLLPSLAFVGNAGVLFQNNSLGHLFSPGYPSSYIGFSLNVPIYSGGQHNNRIKQSQITVLKSQNDLSNLKNGLRLQASQAWIGYINGMQTLKVQKENQELAAEVLRVSKIKYQQGVGSSIEVTQAESALESADNSYIQGLYDALVSKVDLDKAYGRIK